MRQFMDGMHGKMPEREIVPVKPFFAARVAEFSKKIAATIWTQLRRLFGSDSGLYFGGHARMPEYKPDAGESVQRKNATRGDFLGALARV
ncbi:MAG TPA: hypothetical protein VIB39_14125 [Candidatus Angelobacter sp.]|jgi:hypothetical protein